MTDLQLLSKRQVVELLSISRTTLDIWRRERGFPQPISLLGINRWRPAEIQTWVLANAQLTMKTVLPRSGASDNVHPSNRQV